MSDIGDGNPMAEGAGHAARLAAQLAGLAMLGLQQAARVRERQEEQRRQAATADAERARAELRSEHTAARLRFAPGLTDEIRHANVVQAAEVWTAAVPWEQHDTSANHAARAAEARLTELEPELMARYQDKLTREQMPAPEAMVAAHKSLAEDHYHRFVPPQPFPAHGAQVDAPDLGVEGTLRAWEAARLWSGQDERAAVAMGNAEEQLRRLRPAAMATYDERRALGEDPAQAMGTAMPQMTERVWAPEQPKPLDPGAAAARAVGNQFDAAGDHDSGVPDLASTPAVNERVEGLTAAAGADRVADSSTARSAALASQAFPQPVHAGLRQTAGPARPTAPGGAPQPARSRGR